MAQPGVSAQIRKLEGELDAVAGVRGVVDELTGLVRGRVAVGMVTSGAFLDVPDVLADFHTAHPGVEVTLAGAPSGRLLAQVRSGELDLALIGLAGPEPDDVHVEIVTDETLVVVVAPSTRPSLRPGTPRGSSSRPVTPPWWPAWWAADSGSHTPAHRRQVEVTAHRSFPA